MSLKKASELYGQYKEIEEEFKRPEPPVEPKPTPEPPSPGPAPPQPPKPPVPPGPAPGEPVRSKKYHHWNSHAWTHGKRVGGGVAIILCVRDRWTSAVFNGVPMQLHNSLDKGRQVWTIYKNPPGRAGEIIATRNGQKLKILVSDVGISYGECH